MNIDTDLAMNLRRKGQPWHVVAAAVGSTVYFVRKALTEARIVHWRRYQSAPPLLTKFKLEKVKRLKAAGATWKELGRITGIDPGKLERYVKSHSK